MNHVKAQLLAMRKVRYGGTLPDIQSDLAVGHSDSETTHILLKDVKQVQNCKLVSLHCQHNDKNIPRHMSDDDPPQSFCGSAIFSDVRVRNGENKVVTMKAVVLHQFAVLEQFCGQGVGQWFFEDMIEQLPKNFKVDMLLFYGVAEKFYNENCKFTEHSNPIWFDCPFYTNEEKHRKHFYCYFFDDAKKKRIQQEYKRNGLLSIEFKSKCLMEHYAEE